MSCGAFAALEFRTVVSFLQAVKPKLMSRTKIVSGFIGIVLVIGKQVFSFLRYKIYLQGWVQKIFYDKKIRLLKNSEVLSVHIVTVYINLPLLSLKIFRFRRRSNLSLSLQLHK